MEEINDWLKTQEEILRNHGIETEEDFTDQPVFEENQYYTELVPLESTNQNNDEPVPQLQPVIAEAVDKTLTSIENHLDQRRAQEPQVAELFNVPTNCCLSCSADLSEIAAIKMRCGHIICERCSTALPRTQCPSCGQDYSALEEEKIIGTTGKGGSISYLMQYKDGQIIKIRRNQIQNDDIYKNYLAESNRARSLQHIRKRRKEASQKQELAIFGQVKL